MMTTRKFRLVTLTALAVAATFLFSPGASGKEAAGATARDAFERLRSLVGRWEATTSEEITATVTYELHAGGTALFETFVEAEPSGSDMVSAFHLDGDRLMLSHFCSGGNQPRMMARGLDGDRIRFEFVDATNLSGPDAGHIHSAVIRFVDHDHFVSEWTWYENGEPSHTSVRRHTRLSHVPPASR